MGRLFLMALRDQQFKGPIYPINPSADEIDGIKCYRSLLDVPSHVDLALVLVPNQQVLEVIRQCGIKGVKGAVVFSSGFRELGTENGRKLEEELATMACQLGVRVIGPNCMGLYVPDAGLSFFPQLPRESGNVALVSQSGSLANILGRLSIELGIRFSKAISLGNECDLDSADFLEYLANDQKTEVVGVYLEGIREGRKFFYVLKNACSKKPVIVWKVGLTTEGQRAASSHTGSLGGGRHIWSAVLRQCGAIQVDGFEPFVDALVGGSMLPHGLGDRIGIVSGPGGLAVAAAEACATEGLTLGEVLSTTKDRLKKVVPETGTSVNNPIDVGLSASVEVNIYAEATRILANDPNIDALLVIGVGLTPEANEHYAQALVETKRSSGKPVLVVRLPGLPTEAVKTLSEGGIPTFPTAERAIWTYAMARRYGLWREQTAPDSEAPIVKSMGDDRIKS